SYRVRGRAHHGDADVGRVERELPQVGHRENPEASSNDGTIVSERSIRETDPWLEVSLVEFANAGTQSLRTRRLDGAARQRGICHAIRVVRSRTSIDRLQKSLDWHVVVGYDDAPIRLVEGRQIGEWTDKRWQRLPAQPKTQGQARNNPPFVLSIHARLNGVRQNVRSGLRHVCLRRQTQQKIGIRRLTKRRTGQAGGAS